ncbi:hypothetical protein QYE76_019206 [Lolium multiflorum]|uniref:Integrase catalytic domain-containing protein n=1 Tax=Lolium multiflorum TaxID=4521 RepID=A0AAD8R590_LOLMU|nr:hypothetical protein QYE76_019206 [Lolium multiflorum]
MHSIQPYGSLPGKPGAKASDHLGHPRSVRRNVSQVQICAAFASLRMVQSLCVAPLDLVLRYTWVFLLKSKDKTHKYFVDFAKQPQPTYEEEIKAIRTDNGSEFKNYTMREFVQDERIKHEFFAPYTPQQNGVIERKNRTIIEMARTMLDEFKSPYNFWGEAISTAIHYSNRLFLRPLHNKTPYELITGNKPKVMYFRVFGCKCMVKNKKKSLDGPAMDVR